ncbi:MAG TPA: ThiF family adenylyltransferase [Polyangiaceae bacterium]
MLRQFNLSLDDGSLTAYGAWIHYPWSRRLVHVLDEAEFIEVRTNRNRPKITKDEQSSLRSKRVGVVGLSVGSAIAMTLASERCCGELRLADFDTLELSNLNRVRAPIHALGNYKALTIARDIAELDPFLEVKCFFERLDASNLADFLLGEGPLDLCIEECDDLGAKVLVRRMAKQHRIPIVMETSDLGMLDVERFDLEPNLPILHGLLSDLDEWDFKRIRDLPDRDKVPYVMAIVGQDGISVRTRAALQQIGKTLKSWPQLSSAVTRGAGVVAGVSRQVLLGHSSASGRFYSTLNLSPLSGSWQDTHLNETIVKASA